MKALRAIEPTNPWGLTVLEHDTMLAYVEHGDAQSASQALGTNARQVENALARTRHKMRTAAGNGLIVTRTTMLRLWVQWVESKKAPEREVKGRTRWVNVQQCACCHGLGFVPKAATA